MATTLPQTAPGPAITLGQKMYNTGGGLLGKPIAGNGVGQVKMQQGPAMPNTQVARNSFGFGVPTLGSPQTASNPYLRKMAGDIQRRAMDSFGDFNLQTQGNAVGAGVLGGSRQGVAQGVGMGRTMDAMTGQLTGMYGNAYEGDQNRALQKYGIDTGSYNTQRGQDIGMRGQDLQTYNQGLDRNLERYQGDQQYYTQQRGQDLMGAGTGADLVTRGLNTQWLPINNAADVYSKFAGNGTTTTGSSSGGGWQGIAGGLLSGAAMGKQMGWWG